MTTTTRTIRRGMASMIEPGCWQIGIYEVARNDAGMWSACATGPGTIGDGFVGTFATLDAAHVALTGESFNGRRMVAQPAQQQQASATPPETPAAAPTRFASAATASRGIVLVDEVTPVLDRVAETFARMLGNATPNPAAMRPQLVQFERVEAAPREGGSAGWWVRTVSGEQSECFVADLRGTNYGSGFSIAHTAGVTYGVKALHQAMQIATRYALAEMHMRAADRLADAYGQETL